MPALRESAERNNLHFEDINHLYPADEDSVLPFSLYSCLLSDLMVAEFPVSSKLCSFLLVFASLF